MTALEELPVQSDIRPGPERITATEAQILPAAVTTGLLHTIAIIGAITVPAAGPDPVITTPVTAAVGPGAVAFPPVAAEAGVLLLAALPEAGAVRAAAA